MLRVEPEVGLNPSTLRSWSQWKPEVRCLTDCTTETPLNFFLIWTFTVHFFSKITFRRYSKALRKYLITIRSIYVPILIIISSIPMHMVLYLSFFLNISTIIPENSYPLLSFTLYTLFSKPIIHIFSICYIPTCSFHLFLWILLELFLSCHFPVC